tara:strand:- start:313 stop:615 length:303 start_codon:yes stop_codon:yes gene_type:complete
MLLERGIGAEFVHTDPVLLANSLVAYLNEESYAGIVCYGDWSTVRVFFDTLHVCNMTVDSRGVTFEYQNSGPMLSDSRANKVMYAVIHCLTKQPTPPPTD